MAPSRARIILVREMVILADISTPCFERRSVEMIKHYPEPSGSAAGYRGLSLEDLEDAGIRVAERRYGAKDDIFVPGDPDEHLYFVLSGTVRLYKLYGDYKEATVALLKDGDVFGDLSLQEGPGQTVFAHALTDARVAVMRKAVLVEVLKRDPELVVKLFSSLVDRLEQSEEAI